VSANLSALEQALGQGDWREANKQTRLLFRDGFPPEALVRGINSLWEDHSGGSYGFKAQARIWTNLGGPVFEPGYALWEFFKTFGDTVGWRRDGYWARWSSPELLTEYNFPTLDVNVPTVVLPPGCLPFHDVMVTEGPGGNEFSPWDGFSPRDCWGEFVWDRWALLFASVQSW
jgi:hypothetical protein